MGRTAAVVLAAGASERMGEPKALLEADAGQTVLGSLLARLTSAGFDAVVVVTRHDLHDAVAAIAAEHPPIEVLVNPSPGRGRLGSLQLALRDLADQPRAPDRRTPSGLPTRVVVVPVDRPGWSAATLRRLLRRDETSCPSLAGRGGHPLLLCGDDVVRVAEASPDAPLAGLARANYIAVDDPHLHLDLDTPADLPALAAWAAWAEEVEASAEADDEEA